MRTPTAWPQRSRALPVFSRVLPLLLATSLLLILPGLGLGSLLEGSMEGMPVAGSSAELSDDIVECPFCREESNPFRHRFVHSASSSDIARSCSGPACHFESDRAGSCSGNHARCDGNGGGGVNSIHITDVVHLRTGLSAEFSSLAPALPGAVDLFVDDLSGHLVALDCWGSVAAIIPRLGGESWFARMASLAGGLHGI